MAIVRVEVFRQKDKADNRKLQLEDAQMGFKVSDPEEVNAVAWDATDSTGRRDGAPDNSDPVWVIVARKA